MAINFTKMQQKAIETRGNILVSAAAGSGKTAVLVERVINMLTDNNSPVSADKLLIVTFTNAAAAEMRGRIEKRIYEEIQKNPNDENLQRQKYLLSHADICTIDSFCIKLVRENFERCGIQPDFKIGDAAQQQTILNDVMSSLILEYIENPTKDFERLLELCNCEYDEKNLTDLINRIYLYSQQLPFPNNFINGLLLPYQCEFKAGNAWFDMAFDIAERRIEALVKHSEKMLSCAELVNKNTDKYISYADNVAKKIQEIANAYSKNEWDVFAACLKTVVFDRMPSCDRDDSSGESFKLAQKNIKSIVGELCEIFVDSEIVKNNISKNFGAVKLLVEIINKFSDRLFDALCKENTFTFYNMEQLALNLLCEYKDGEVLIKDEASELCNHYDEVLVDEFQDVNDLQNMLFYALSNRDEKLFVVGDVKQSIYGFRGSNPDNFLKKKNEYILIDDANNKDSKKIILSDNFRSRKGVCEAVNFFFGCLMAGQCGDIVYDDEECLNASGNFTDNAMPAAELLVVDRCEETDKSLLQIEAQKIADYIISVMHEGNIITDSNSLRCAKYSDFAILLDKVKDKANVISEVLSQNGIPVTLGGDVFLQSTEISTVMSLLQVIDNPKCDVELLEVMMSPLFGFTAEEMAKIRINQKRGSLYSAVVAYQNTGDEKTIAFINSLIEFRRDAAVLSVDRLISKLVHSTDILNMMSALDSGSVRRANLFMLINYAKGFAARFDSGIYGFIKYMKSLPENAFKTAAGSDDNSVKIMSMHNSKGLQFSVCILANLSSLINNADSVSRVLFSEKGGIAFKYYDEEICGDIEMLGHTIMSDAAQVKTVEEKLRLLYVAMTRAIDRLCIVCSAKNLNNKLIKLSDALQDEVPFVSREFLENGRNMSDWILSCALLHPNSDVLRNYAGVKPPIVATNSRLKMTILNGEDENKNHREETVGGEGSCDFELVEQIKSNADFVYPYEALRHLQAKASVSRLVHSAQDDRFSFCDRPLFMQDYRLSGAARGTALHHIMQYINMTEHIDVTAEIERLVEWKFITPQEGDSVDVCAIKNFFETTLYKRILHSGSLHREMRFLTEIPAKQLDPTMDINVDDANIIVQGAVDLCFEEEDGIVVLDFKTDMVDNLEQLVERYGEQLEIYSAAAQKIFNKPVKEKIIYSFHLGDSISF